MLANLHETYDELGVPVLSLFFDYKSAARQSLQSVRRSLLRQLITSRKPIRIPEAVMAAWRKVEKTGKTPLKDSQLKAILEQELQDGQDKFLVVDALDEAEGCLNTIDAEIDWLQDCGVCIFSTVLSENRILNERAFCYWHQNGAGPYQPLDFFYKCDECTRLGKGLFGKGVEICRDCYMNKDLRCDDPGHSMAPPDIVYLEVRSSLDDMTFYSKRFLDDATASANVPGADQMHGRRMNMLAKLRRKLGEDAWAALPGKISHAADGNFLLAHLTLESLEVQRNISGAMTVIKQVEDGSLPSINKGYRERLQWCLRGDRATVARAYLTIVAGALEVLEYDQLDHAAAVEPGDHDTTDFVDRCSDMDVVVQDTVGLLAIDASGTTDAFLVGFSHRTFSVYIAEHPDELLPNADQAIFDACLSYLGLDAFASMPSTFAELDGKLKEYPFARYAACYWGIHASRVKQTAGNATRVLELLTDANRLNCIMQIAWRTPSMPIASWDVDGGISPLHACAFYGLDSLCVALVETMPTVDPVEDTYHQTPLIYACRMGNVEVVRCLLRAGANPNHLTTLGKSPLLEAIQYQRHDIIDLLLEHTRTDINLRAARQDDKTPLVRAAQLGQESTLAKLLSRKKILVNETDGYICTALSRAVQGLHRGCIEKLLSHPDVDLTIRDSLGSRTPLDWLADSSIDYWNKLGQVLDIATMLMDHPRAALPSDHATVLAIQQNRQELLRIFVNKSLHHLYTDDYGRNFLHLAATEGVCATVTLFHKRMSQEPSFNIDVLDRYKATALHAVCARLSDPSHADTVKFLLEAGANPTLKDDQGFTPPRLARRASQELWDSHVKMLFTAVKDEPDLNDATAPPSLEAVLRTAKIDILKDALDRLPDPIDPETAHYSGTTILHHAMELEDDFRLEALALLLPRSKAFLSDTDTFGQTCAHDAVNQGSLEALKLLCEAGIDIDRRDKWGMTPFDVAQRSPRLDMCVYLACLGAKLPASDDIHPETLRVAVDCGDLIAVERLVAANVDLNFRDAVSGRTNIQRAEELLDEALMAANQELLDRHDPSAMLPLEEFRKIKASQPEVVKRDKILQILRKAQEAHPAPRSSDVDMEKGLAKLLARLKALDPETLLSTAPASDRFASGNGQPKPIRRDTTFGGPRRAMSTLPPVPAAVATSLKLGVDTNVVIIAVALILGLVAVAITWIQSSGSRIHYLPQLHPDASTS